MKDKRKWVSVLQEGQLSNIKKMGAQEDGGKAKPSWMKAGKEGRGGGRRVGRGVEGRGGEGGELTMEADSHLSKAKALKSRQPKLSKPAFACSVTRPVVSRHESGSAWPAEKGERPR